MPYTKRTVLILGMAGCPASAVILLELRKSYLGVSMRSLCPSCSSPSPSMTIGVTLMMVMMTTEARISRVMVERERQLISPFDFMFTAQFFLACVSISLKL